MNLGKILFLLVLPCLLLSKVEIEAPKSFYTGEAVAFTIKAKGVKVKLPNISNIEGFAVQSAGTSSSTTIINGQTTQTISKSYMLRPNKTFTIPAFEVEVDGKIEKTNPLKVVKKEVKKTISSDYSFDISVDKKQLYVGQELLFTIKLKYKNSLNLIDLEFFRPDFENFWAKELESAKQKQEEEFIVHELKYLLFPQKSGKIKLDPLRINLVVSDSSIGYGIFARTLTKKIPVYSNGIELDIKPLPSNVNLIGEFEISSSVDNTTIKQGQGVSYTLKISGRGNIDDIEEIKLDVPDGIVYENPSKKEFNIKKGFYGGTFTKTYSIVASNDFTIPSISLKYFDKQTKLVKTIKTKPYNIKVNAKEEKQDSKLQVKKIENAKNNLEKDVEKGAKKNIIKSSFIENILYFVLGMLVSFILVIIYFYFKRKSKPKEDTNFEKSIKNAKTKDELFKLLVVYINIDKQLDKIIYDIESKNSLDIKSVKKQIINIIKEQGLKI